VSHDYKAFMAAALCDGFSYTGMGAMLHGLASPVLTSDTHTGMPVSASILKLHTLFDSWLPTTSHWQASPHSLKLRGTRPRVLT